MEESTPTSVEDESILSLPNSEQEKAASPQTEDQDANFLTLPAFRMMCLSNPLLDTFFTSQLPASFRLEAPHRATVNGTSIWHDVLPNTPSSATISTSTSTVTSPRTSQGIPASAPAATTSFATSALPSTSARAYSKDVSTGVVGRIGGFLNNFLGDEVKSKVDELADSLGEKLNTKVVRGPLPSFTILDEYEMEGGIARKKKSSGTLGMDDLNALEEQRRERRRLREWEEKQEEARAASTTTTTTTMGNDSGGKSNPMQLRGIDINAAQESLRMATESVVEGTQTGGEQFGDDVPVLAEGPGDEEEEEEEVVVDDDVVSLSKS